MGSRRRYAPPVTFVLCRVLDPYASRRQLIDLDSGIARPHSHQGASALAKGTRQPFVEDPTISLRPNVVLLDPALLFSSLRLVGYLSEFYRR
jgi:hypothetical protein